MVDKYKYFINKIQVFPKNSGIDSFEYIRRSDEDVIFEFMLTSEMTFDLHTPFDFKTQEETNASQELTFDIFKRCGNRYMLEWSGVFSVAEGHFDVDNCEFKVKPRKQDHVLADIEVNILEVARQVKGGAPFNVMGVITNTNPFTLAGQRQYPQAKWLRDVIDYVIKKSSPKVRGYKQGGGVPTSLVVCSLSDVQEPPPSNLATVENITFNELMYDLNSMFDCFWFIDDNYDLNIEHRSFFNGVAGLDLTLPEFSQYVLKSNKYSYLLNEFPKYEFWRSCEGPQYVQLSYQGLGVINKNTNQKIYQPKKIRTDYVHIRYRGNNSTANGLFMFSVFNSGPGGYEMNSSANGQNADLAPGVLIYYFTTNRPYKYSLYKDLDSAKNGDVTHSGAFTAADVRPTKIQDEISIPLCCVEDFDVKDRIKTPMGIGVIDKATLDKKSQHLKLTIKYKVPKPDTILPSQILNCDLWLRADTDVTYDIPYFLVNGIKLVEQWDDQSGNGNHVEAPAPGNRPVWDDVNGQIIFYGGNEFLWTQNPFQLFPNKRGTIFLFFDDNLIGNNVVLSTQDNLAIGPYWDYTVISGVPKNMGEGALVYANKPPINGLMMLNRENDTDIVITQNGMTLVPEYTTANTVPKLTKLVIGDNQYAAVPNGGVRKVKEVVIFSRSLTAYEMQLMEYYFATRGIYLIY